MFELTTDENIWLKFWRDEKDNTPAHFQAGTGAWHRIQEEFLDWCRHCAQIYLIDDIALLYVENIDNNANIHFSVLRGHKPEMDDLLALRDILIQNYEMIFGWCGKHNVGLKRMLNACGLKFYGFEMVKGWHRNKPLEWQCYSLTREQYASNGN